MTSLKAILLIKVVPGREREVLNKIISIREVLEAGIILGDYDIYVIIEIEKQAGKEQLLSALFRIITHNIRSIEGITSTLTLITFDYLTRKKWNLVYKELIRPSPSLME